MGRLPDRLVKKYEMGKFAITYAEGLQKDADKYFEQHPLATTSDLAV